MRKLQRITRKSIADEIMNSHEDFIPVSTRNPNNGGPYAVLTTSNELNKLLTVPR